MARDEGRGRAATGRTLRLPTNHEPLAPRPDGGWMVLPGGVSSSFPTRRCSRRSAKARNPEVRRRLPPKPMPKAYELLLRRMGSRSRSL
eukprot:5680943-Alexandrium_andersonii.AAC.1